MLGMILTKPSEVSKLSKSDDAITAMLETRDKAVDEAYNQFQMSHQSLKDQSVKAQTNESRLTEGIKKI